MGRRCSLAPERPGGLALCLFLIWRGQRVFGGDEGEWDGEVAESYLGREVMRKGLQSFLV